MHRTTVVLAALAISLSLLALTGMPGLGSERGPPAAPLLGARTLAGGATDYVVPLNAYGGTTRVFATGATTGRVYFAASDPSDATATVSIFDQNATRDNVPVPADRWTVNFSASSYNSSLSWGGYYLLPLTLTDGGYWNISISGPNGGTYSTWFEVITYSADMLASASAYLPGANATVSYALFSTANGAPLASGAVTALTVGGSYPLGSGGTRAIFPTVLNLTAQPLGQFSVTIPTGIAFDGSVSLWLWANQTTSSGHFAVSSDLTLLTGGLSVVTSGLATCLGTSCALGLNPTLAAGSVAFVQYGVEIEAPGASAPAAGIAVALTFQSDGKNLTSVPGSPPARILTNSSGSFTVSFLASPSAFSATNLDAVVLNATDPVDGAISANVSLGFYVSPLGPGAAAIAVALSSADYAPGETITATWSIGGTNATLAAEYDADAYVVTGSPPGASGSSVLALGTITSTGRTGVLDYTIPGSFTGAITIEVHAHNATSEITGASSAVVGGPLLLLTPSESEYSPGDTVGISVTPLGAGLTGTTIYATATVGANGPAFWSGTISGDHFTLGIPSVAPPSELYVTVVAQSPTGGIVASGALMIYELTGLGLSLGVASASQYSDGSFQPGETIQISYAITALAGETLGHLFTLELYPEGDSATGGGFATVTLSSSSGTFAYTIPSGMPSGIQLFEAQVSLVGCPTGPSESCGGFTVFSIAINSAPSGLSYEIGAGSGVTIGWVVLIVLIAALALVLLWGWRRGRRPTRMSPVPVTVSPPAATTPSPPAGTGGSGAPSPAPNWREEGPESGPGTSSGPSGSAPPLPTPPTSPP